MPDLGPDMTASKDLAPTPPDEGPIDLLPPVDLAGTDATPPPFWQVESSNPSSTVLFTFVFGLGPDKVYVAASDGQVRTSPGDGTWTAMPTVANAYLLGFWASAANDLYTVGYLQDSTGNPTAAALLHSTGSGWTNLSTDANPLTAIWGSGPDDIYVVGGAGVIFHFDGNTWQSQTSGTTMNLWAVWGTGIGDVWAAGYCSTVLHKSGTGAWGVVQADPVSQNCITLGSIWGSSANDVYVAGENGAMLHATDGKTFTTQSTGMQQSLAVWGSSTSDVWAACSDGTVLHSTGNGTWTPMPSMSATTNALYSIWGSGPNNVYVVGDHATILHHQQ